MKLLTLFFLTMLPLGVSAQDEWFVYAGALTQKYTIDNSDYNDQFFDFTGTEGSIDSIDQFNGTVGIGFHINETIKLQIDHTQDVSFDDDFSFPFSGGIFQSADIELNFTNVGIFGNFPINDTFDFEVGGGLSFISETTKFEFDDSTFRQNEKYQRPFVDLGIEYRINSRLSGKLGFQQTNYHRLRKTYLNFYWYL